MSYGTGAGPGGPYQQGPYQQGPYQQWPDQQGPDQHWAEHDDHGSGSGASAGVIALVAFLAVLVLALLGVVAYLFLRPGGLSGEPADPMPEAAVASSSSTQPAPTTSQDPTTEAAPTPTSEAETVTVTRPPERTTSPGAVYPAGADRSGWTANSQARCNAGDPASMIGRTDQASFSICVNPDNGRYYYRGSAGGNGVEVDDPVVGGGTATITNNGVVYSISPAGMTIFENGTVISDQQMRQFWVE